MEGNADFAGPYWPQLEQWAEYLKDKGFDPENQLCTDDFAGHLAHNVNLSAKAICGLGAFAKLCEMRGDKAEGGGVLASWPRSSPQRWVQGSGRRRPLPPGLRPPGHLEPEIQPGLGPHPRARTSFPPKSLRKEMDFYKQDPEQATACRSTTGKDYTKLDWIAVDRDADAEPRRLRGAGGSGLPVPQRNARPLADDRLVSNATRAQRSASPRGRWWAACSSQMLYDKTAWKKWAGRDKTKAIRLGADAQAAEDDGRWCPLRTRSRRRGVTRPARLARIGSNRTLMIPSWKQGKSGFGTRGTPGAVIGTTWNTRDIWLRRQVNIPAVNRRNLQAWIHHDEDAEMYINGVLAVKVSGWTSQYHAFPIRPAARAALKPGENLISIHCHQRTGGQYIDAGFLTVQPLQTAQARN